MIKDIIAFVFSKAFIKNLAFFILTISLLIVSIFVWLHFYTNHGETIEVPDLIDFSISEAMSMVDNKDLRIEVQDSVYIRNHMPGRIVQQNPSAFAVLTTGDTIRKMVKEDRKIYVTTTRLTPPNKTMPDLIDISERVALIKLETAGLSIGKITYEPNQIGDNLILEQLYKGKAIKPGIRLKMGEKIDLVVSKKTLKSTAVPDLYGTTLIEAKQKLKEATLNLGIVLKCVGCKDKIDSSLARIYDQKPRSIDNFLGIGSNVDIYLTTDSTDFN